MEENKRLHFNKEKILREAEIMRNINLRKVTNAQYTIAKDRITRFHNAINAMEKNRAELLTGNIMTLRVQIKYYETIVQAYEAVQNNRKRREELNGKKIL